MSFVNTLSVPSDNVVRQVSADMHIEILLVGDDGESRIPHGFHEGGVVVHQLVPGDLGDDLHHVSDRKSVV